MTPDEKFAEIQTHLPALLFELQRLDVPAGSPTRASVVLPRRLEVGPSDVDGRGAVARILGLPVRWVDDEVVGILVEIPRAT